MQSVPIATNVVSSNPNQAVHMRYNIMLDLQLPMQLVIGAYHH